ncbi:MAG: dihydrodipicolinate synthase family protein [Alphaproteobacteria bacterium]|nr:dihydrodipicolinate synthase family protein [Alphaproteobacteria bacterium]
MPGAGRINEKTEGVYIISATPFAQGGLIDLASADRLVEFYIGHGVTGITILGMMGEANKLTAEEADGFMHHMLGRVAGRVPVVVGVSGAGIGNLAHLSKQSMDAGAAGVMIAPTPGLNTEAKVHGYFAQVFEALGPNIPVCYQDYPQSTGVHISVDCFNRLVDEFPQLIMFKHEDCPGLGKLSALRASGDGSARRRVSVLVGNGGLYLPQELARGADGAMTGFAFPEMLVQVVSLFKAGKTERAQDLFDAYLPIVRHEQQPGFGLALRKEILHRRGALACPATRAPGPCLNKTDMAELDQLLARLETRVAAVG